MYKKKSKIFITDVTKLYKEGIIFQTAFLKLVLIQHYLELKAVLK